jgi:hypothetical protein
MFSSFGCRGELYVSHHANAANAASSRRNFTPRLAAFRSSTRLISEDSA